MMWRRIWGLGGLAGLIAGVIGVGAGRPPATAAGPPSAGRATAWIIAGSALRDIASQPAVQTVLDHPTTWVSLSVNGRGIPPGWHVTPFVHFASAAAMAAWVRQGHFPPGLRGLGYDNERWPLTPTPEQRDPTRFVQEAAALAHAHHWAYLQLGNLPVDGSRVGGARWAQVMDLQVQSAERNPARYAQMVHQLAAEARSINPRVQVIAGLSTNPPPGTPVTLAELEQDVTLTDTTVNGYWLNIPNPGEACPRCGAANPSLAVALLTWWAHGAHA